MADLRIFAGQRALRQIRERGIRADEFQWMAGASGGPKWFVLYGLDRYLAGRFFAGRTQPLRLIGSSAGAWRMACHAHHEPVAALERLAALYSTQVYSTRPDRAEISAEARHMLDGMLGPQGAQSIANNPVFRVYLLANRMRGLLRSEHRVPLQCGLLAAALLNVAGRRHLRSVFERWIFINACETESAMAFDDLVATFVSLTESNVRQALMASGSIPLVMEAVKNVEGATEQVFRDGGMLDYHLHLPFHGNEGLVLYPHFYSGIVPGWFDRFTPWRKTRPDWFDNVVVVAPSREFVAQLPYGKIPDRHDFVRLDAKARIQYWQQVLAASERLADAFDKVVNMPGERVPVEPWVPRRAVHV